MYLGRLNDKSFIPYQDKELSVPIQGLMKSRSGHKMFSNMRSGTNKSQPRVMIILNKIAIDSW